MQAVLVWHQYQEVLVHAVFLGLKKCWGWQSGNSAAWLNTFSPMHKNLHTKTPAKTPAKSLVSCVLTAVLICVERSRTSCSSGNTSLACMYLEERVWETSGDVWISNSYIISTSVTVFTTTKVKTFPNLYIVWVTWHWHQWDGVW